MLKVINGQHSTLSLNTEAGELILSGLKVVYHPAQRAVFVADVHLGKALAFRQLGVPVPAGTTPANLSRLTEAINQFEAQRLFILGDLLHSKAAHHPDLIYQLADWRKQHAQVEMKLVAGNHDDKAGYPPANLDIEVVQEPYAFAGLNLYHHPVKNSVHGASLAGHIHPVGVIRGRGRTRFRLPCFARKGAHIVLPSFGEFTGGFECKVPDYDALYLVAQEN